jgi:hypothetical protein
MNIEDYLEHIQRSESIFPMDSFSLPKKKKSLRKYDYPNRLGEQNQSLRKIKKRAMIDFDGPIHRYSKGPQDGSLYDRPSDGAKEFIDWLKEKGYEIVIFTSRASKTSAKEFGDDHNRLISNVKNYLKKHRIHYDLITAEKLAAEFYIDDLAIHYNNWNSVRREVIKRMNLGG